MITVYLPPSLRHREVSIFREPHSYLPFVGTYYRGYYRPYYHYLRPSVRMGRRKIQRCNTAELKAQLLDSPGGRWFRPTNGYDEIFPGILLGDAETALSTILLKELGVTHVLNAAQGHNNTAYNGYVSTHPSYYSRKGIKYLGVPAMDMPGFYIKPFFRQAAEFIQDCLNDGGKVLVHCQSGVSRSAALVAAFLMLKRGMNVQGALRCIKKRRSIFPNHGFLSQLCDLDYELRRSGQVTDDPDLELLDVQRQDLSPDRSYPRFSLLHTKALQTYSNTKSYVPPRRAVSCERVNEVPPRRAVSCDRFEVASKSPFASNPLVDSTTRPSRSRQRSPVRYSKSPTVSYSSYINNEDEDDYDPVSSKVFDTYRRYSRRSTSPLPITSTEIISLPEAKPFDRYWSPKTVEYDIIKYPRYVFYDKLFSPATTYQYINNLNRYYDTYKYVKTESPFFGQGVTQAPYVQWYDTPNKTYLRGYTYKFHYPYTETYFKPLSKYPTTARTLNTHSVYFSPAPLRTFDRI
ncbi:uncharacterized protein [Macrobrachium rosenbergii]|uniref:uncharacterized protein isoform X1 n=2 Tax=Macrobrachium rosenbergii TaxID=79674 RepID=UPI0034D70934